MIEVILEALYDGLKAFIFIFIIYIILSFIEVKIANKLNKENRMSPLYGALIGLIPQCGVSVVASDLYLKRHISVGTLVAIFLACSDEAIPILFSYGGTKIVMILPLIIIKFIVGFLSGVIIDLIISKKQVTAHLQTCNHNDIDVHMGCCHHHIDDEKESLFHKHIWHPFLHSLKLFCYVLLINIIFGSFVYFVGESRIETFLSMNKYIAPLISMIVGLIPNCASSIILAQLFISGGLSFGATLSGLCVNAGLGLVFLFKSKNGIKRNCIILLTLAGISLLVGYLTCLISGF